MNNKNEIWDADEKLFLSKLKDYSSSEEAIFFQNMRFKEEYEPTLSNDVIMSETDNPLGIYIQVSQVH